jgi:hypothetical protein
LKNTKGIRGKNRLHYTFDAAVTALLMRPSDLANRLGESYDTLYAYRAGRKKLSASTARQLAAYLRGKASRLLDVSQALERAAEVAEAGKS